MLSWLSNLPWDALLSLVAIFSAVGILVRAQFYRTQIADLGKFNENLVTRVTFLEKENERHKREADEERTRHQAALLIEREKLKAEQEKVRVMKDLVHGTEQLDHLRQDVSHLQHTLDKHAKSVDDKHDVILARFTESLALLGSRRSVDGR
jgi:protein subunit release factor B